MASLLHLGPLQSQLPLAGLAGLSHHPLRSVVPVMELPGLAEVGRRCRMEGLSLSVISLCLAGSGLQFACAPFPNPVSFPRWLSQASSSGFPEAQEQKNSYCMQPQQLAAGTALKGRPSPQICYFYPILCPLQRAFRFIVSFNP